MSEIFKELRNDHEIQRELMDRLVKTEGDSDKRKEIFYTLKTELEEHAKYEERYFYQPLLDSDLTQDKARHSIAEHKEMDDLLEKLSMLDMSSPQWLSVAKELKHKVIHHLDEEEQEVFPIAGKELNQEEKTQLGNQYREKMEEAPRTYH